MTYQFPQHSQSNNREASDLYLLPSHYDFLGEVDSEIKLLKDTYEYVSIDQQRIAQLRQESNNTLNYGDAVEKILKKELNNKSYSGMCDAHKIPDGVYEYDISDQHQDERNKKIFTSLFDSSTKTIYYFLR